MQENINSSHKNMEIRKLNDWIIIKIWKVLKFIGSNRVNLKYEFNRWRKSINLNILLSEKY